MIEQLTAMPKYKAYKDSGVEWLGEIPKHWQVEKGKWLFSKAERPVRADDDVVTCFRDGQVTLRKNRRTEGFTNAIQEHGYQGIRKGDLVIHAMDAFAGAIGVSDSDGKSSPVYSTCFPRALNTVDVYFYAYFLRNLALSGFIESLTKGIRERSTDFRFKDFAALNLSFPPLSEQLAIAAFLDRKTAQIDHVVAIKEKQIALLKERKQILIQNAVTRGLAPNVPMRDSGVKWIGEIPAHWSCARFKMHSKIQSGITLGKSYLQQNFVEMPYIRVANVQSGYFKLDDIATISVPKNEIPRYLLQNGDILVTEGGDIDKLGRGTVWRDEIKPCLHQNHVFAIRVNQSILSQDFVSNFLATDMARKYFIDTATKTTNLASTNRTHLGNLHLPLPSLTEQAAIVAHIETESAKIDRAISIQQQQIDKLKEYKTTLINSAVTGKIRVSELVEGSVPELADTMVA
ncbi:MAG: restriction endonuclease subunit S [Methylobacter sp.]